MYSVKREIVDSSRAQCTSVAHAILQDSRGVFELIPVLPPCARHVSEVSRLLMPQSKWNW